MPAPIIDHFVERVRLPESLTRLLGRGGYRAAATAGARASRRDGSESSRRCVALGQRQSRPVAANLQNYEVPSRFFELTLGLRLKYSAGLWNEEAASLNAGSWRPRRCASSG